MQEQDQEKPEKTGWKKGIWSWVALLLLAAGVLAFCLAYRNLPCSSWRDASKTLPWEAAGVSIEKAEACWKASAGDARMAIRSYNFPVFRMELGEALGKGHLVVHFRNGQGVQMGDRVFISYADGKFIPRKGNSMEVTEKEATVRLEDGFLSQDDYILHQFNQDDSLWRVVVEYRPEGGEMVEIGHLCILPNDL